MIKVPAYNLANRPYPSPLQTEKTCERVKFPFLEITTGNDATARPIAAPSSSWDSLGF